MIGVLGVQLYRVDEKSEINGMSGMKCLAGGWNMQNARYECTVIVMLG